MTKVLYTDTNDTNFCLLGPLDGLSPLNQLANQAYKGQAVARSADFMSKQGITFNLPEPELEQSRFFACDEASVRLWIEQLPMANLGETTRQLYQALSEFNRVRLAATKRLALLELLRTPVYFCSRRLAKHYLNQPILLPEQARRVADLAHTLHLLLAQGYTLALAQTVSGGRSGVQLSPGALVAKTIHRATTDHCLNMQRHFQLYQEISADTWQTLHKFYLLAKEYKVLDKSIEDSEFGSCTVEDNYLRALLLGCCKPNQLRQEDFHQLFAPLARWASLCKFSTLNNEALFCIDLQNDQAPVYRELFEKEVGPAWHSLDTRKLAQHLKQLLVGPDRDKLLISDNGFSFSRDLLVSLLLAWGKLSKRCHMRAAEQDTLELCIGLNSAHHYVSGEINFEALIELRGAAALSLQKDNPFLKTQGQMIRQKDVWDSPYEANLGQTDVAVESMDKYIRDNQPTGQAEGASGKKFRSHQVDIVNSSAHGYCLSITGDVQGQIKPGEIIALREPGIQSWRIGNIRWVRFDDQGNIQLGLELISPSAEAYGARIIQKRGGQTDYHRVLMLPELAATKQPVTLLTPKLPYKTGMKVVLNRRGKESEILLERRLNTVGAYNRFLFRYLSSTHVEEAEEQKTSEKGFDSLWKNL